MKPNPILTPPPTAEEIREQLKRTIRVVNYSLEARMNWDGSDTGGHPEECFDGGRVRSNRKRSNITPFIEEVFGSLTLEIPHASFSVGTSAILQAAIERANDEAPNVIRVSEWGIKYLSETLIQLSPKEWEETALRGFSWDEGDRHD